MKNLRITKIITALIVIIWVPSSFAASPNTFKVEITNGPSAVNFIYAVDGSSVRIETCQERHNCKEFGTHANDELFKEFSKDYEKNRFLAEEKNISFIMRSISAGLERISPFIMLNGIGKRTEKIDPVTHQKLTVPVFTVENVFLKSIYLEDISKLNMFDFYNHLSKLRMVKKNLYDITGVTSIYIRVKVKDKVIKELIKTFEEKYKAPNKAFNSSSHL